MSTRAIAAIVVGISVIAGCAGPTARRVSSANTTATTDDGCPVMGCVSTVPANSSFSLPGSTTTTAPLAATGSWAAATANLTGLPSQCGNVTLVSASAGANMVIAGIATQGLWATQPGSTGWSRLGGGPGSAAITDRPSSVTYDPSHQGTFWVSGIYGAGAYETHDNGATFQQLGDLTHSDLVSVDLSDPARRTLLSGRHEAAALYRSSDGGSTWADLSSTLPNGVGFTVAPLVLDAQVHLLGTTGGPVSGVYRSADAGMSWTRVYPVGVAGPPLVTKPDGAIYWVLDQGRGLIKSTDRGISWHFVGFDSSASGSLLQLPNGWIAGIGRNVAVSRDGGTTWEPLGPSLPYTPTGFTYSPAEKSFFAWRSDCAFKGDTSVKPDAIMRMSADLPAK